jgi:hypothetical protein
MSQASQAVPSREFGKVLYGRMLKNFDYSQIVWTMKRYNSAMSDDKANALLDAFLQWFSLIPSNREDRYLVMFQSPVEEAFHSFVLNTRLYSEFCAKFLGQFFHHDPLVDESGPEVERLAWYTVRALENEFGNTLQRELKNWRVQLESGEYKVACVGPGGHCHT